MCHNKQQAEMLAFGQHYKKKKKVNFQAEFPISEMCFDGFFVPRYILHIQTPLKQHDSCSLKNCIYSQNGHRFSLTHFQTWTHDYLFLPPKQRKHNRRYPDISKGGAALFHCSVAIEWTQWVFVLYPVFTRLRPCQYLDRWKPPPKEKNNKPAPSSFVFRFSLLG